MNNVALVGNLAGDPVLRETGSGIPFANFTVAVRRRYKSANGPDTDFISCVAWRQTAKFISQYFCRGSKIGILGSLRTRSYDDADGRRKYVAEVVCDSVEFVSRKAENPAAHRERSLPTSDSTMDIEEIEKTMDFPF